MKTIFSIGIMLCMAGCSSVSPVTPTGPNSYMVGSNAHGGFSSDAEVKALAINRANQFCAEQGKVAQVTSSQSSGIQMWTPQNAEVNFSCVSKP
jgi:hypothetical protein